MFRRPLGRVLITGGAGFIGSHIAEELAKEKEEVLVLDDLSTGKVENISHLLKEPNFSFTRGDIRNEKTLLKTLKDVNVIFHDAALTCVPESIDMPKNYHEVNLNGTLNLLETARRSEVKRVVYASSSSVYEDTLGALTESAPVKPKSPYALTKITAEKYCLLYTEIYGIETVILRYFNVYGPRQRPTGAYADVISKFIERVRKGLPPEIYGDGEQTRDFVHVKDVVQANILASLNDNATGEIFNIGCGKAVTINSLALMIIKILGAEKLEPTHSMERKGDVYHNCADISKAMNQLKYQPKISLETGLINFVKGL